MAMLIMRMVAVIRIMTVATIMVEVPMITVMIDCDESGNGCDCGNDCGCGDENESGDN